MTNLTVHYEFNLPTVGGDADQWGDLLNANWAAADTLLKAEFDDLKADITSLQNALEALRIPVNGLYLATSSVNPNTSLGYGTWEEYASGRALVGVGNNGDSSWSNGSMRGSERVSLSVDNLPSHSHSHNLQASEKTLRADFLSGQGGRELVKPGTNTSTSPSAGEEVVDIDFGQSRARDTLRMDHTHNITGSIGSTGSGESFYNVQPSIGVYVWRRTA